MNGTAYEGLLGRWSVIRIFMAFSFLRLEIFVGYIYKVKRWCVSFEEESLKQCSGFEEFLHGI
jgi:hypothetical protein